MTRVIFGALSREFLAGVAFAIGQVGFVIGCFALVWVILLLVR